MNKSFSVQHGNIGRRYGNIQFILSVKDGAIKNTVYCNFFGALRKMCTRVRNGRSRSSKVIDFGDHRKRIAYLQLAGSEQS